MDKNKYYGVSWRHTLTLILLFSSIISVSAQKLKGIVTDSRTQEPIIGATVSLKNVNNNKTLAVTDYNGQFKVEVRNTPATLVVSYAGYVSQEIDVYEVTDEELPIELQEDFNALNDVVVIGYGTQKRQDIVSSISTVNKELLKQPVSSVESLLSGAVAGLNVTQTSGQPGASSILRIRGGNSITGGNEPLYVIDGFIVYNDPESTKTGVAGSDASLDPLAFLNPSDIENIEVLKDVSATAIYGTRGANGVIIITTKKGSHGRNNLNYSANFGWSTISKKLDFLNAWQYADLFNEIRSDVQLDQPTQTYDWQDAALRTGFQQQHQISATGGDELSRYSISASYKSQEGIVKGTDQTQYTGRLNYERKLFGKLLIGATANGAYNKVKGLNNTNNMFAPNTWFAAITHTPYTSIYNADGSYNYTPTPQSIDIYDGRVGNPISDLENTLSETLNTRFLGNAFIEWQIIDHLKLKASFGADISDTKQNFYAPSYTTSGLATNGYASVGQNKTTTWQTEYTANYENIFNKVHNLQVLAGYTAQRTDRSGFASSSYGFSNDATGFNSLGAAATTLPSSSFAYVSTLQSWIGRVNYSYASRYSVSATLRADGSSRFAKDHQWGFFPSLGFAWNIDQEPWIKLGKNVDYLKLRASIGTVGNQEIGDYQYVSNMQDKTVIVNSKQATSYVIANKANPDLKWETTSSYNIGLSAAFFNNRLTTSLDVYYKKTNDLLLNVPVEQVTGFNTVLRNAGSVENKGIEFEVSGILLNRKDLQWTVNANIAHNSNKVTNLGNSEYYQPHFDTSTLQYVDPLILAVGQPLGTFYGYVFDGIFQANEDLSKYPSQTVVAVEPGNPRYKDINGDNVVNEQDRTYIGNIQPDFTYGLSSKLTWKNFDFFVSLAGSQGNKLFNALACRLERGNYYYNSLASVGDRWTSTNASTSVQKASTSTSIFPDSRFAEDASYLKVRNIQLGYTLPLKQITSDTRLRLYVSLINFFTITGYSGYDPEANRNGISETNALYQGVDYGTYPSAKTVQVGFNITF